MRLHRVQGSFLQEPVSDFDSESDQEEASELICRVEAKLGTPCDTCGRSLCLHQLLANSALGTLQQPKCLECLAAGLDQSVTDLANQLLGYVNRRDCYRTAWDSASKREGVQSTDAPCFFPNSADGEPPQT